MKLYSISSLFSLLIFFFASTAIYAQNLEWLEHVGGLKSDKGTTVVTDHEGNIYFTGYYNEQAQFGPFDTGFSYQKSKETFVCKMDPTGTILWVTNATNYYDDRGLGLCVDPSGNVYVTGTCWGGLDWPPLSVYNSSSYTDQIYVTKIDPSGNVIWMKNAGVNQSGYPYNDDHGQDLASDSQGNIFVTGFISNNMSTNSVATFDAINIPVNAHDSLAFLAKLTNDGNWLWVRTFDGEPGSRDNGIAVDDEDNVYVVGGFKGPANFEGTILTSNGSQDIFVTKYLNDGTFDFAIAVHDSLNARADQICYGKDGHMYVTGEFRTEVLFGTDDLNNYGAPGDKDIFVAKMTKEGEWIWATKAGSKQSGDRGIGIDANDQGNIFVCGQYRGDAKFGDLEVSAGSDSTELFVGMINSEGKWQWVKSGGGPMADRAASIAVDTACNVYAVGFFRDSMTMDSLSLTSYFGNDIFILKISDACNGSGTEPPGDPEDPTNEDNFEFNHSNVFTPNNDGINDQFVFCSPCDAEGHIQIFNRWGNTVFEANNLSTPWNGNNKSGEPVVDGTYFYIVDVNYQSGDSERFTGHITLAR